MYAPQSLIYATCTPTNAPRKSNTIETDAPGHLYILTRSPLYFLSLLNHMQRPTFNVSSPPAARVLLPQPAPHAHAK
jgi:hypothetical protein